MALTLLLLLACPLPEPAQGGACSAVPRCADGFGAREDGLCYETPPEGCPPGTEPREDGMCYGPAPGRAPESALARLACHGRAPPGDELDLALGCVDRVCVGAWYADVRVIWGEPDTCVAESFNVLICAFGPGRTAWFRGAQAADGPAEAAWVKALEIDTSWKGADPNGIRPGASFGCLTRWLGAPSYADLQRDDAGELVPVRASWMGVTASGEQRPWDAKTSGSIQELRLTFPGERSR